MAEFGKIDNQLDAAFEAWPDKSGDVGEKVKEVGSGPKFSDSPKS
jgi:hypothetical protein